MLRQLNKEFSLTVFLPLRKRPGPLPGEYKGVTIFFEQKVGGKWRETKLQCKTFPLQDRESAQLCLEILFSQMRFR